MPHSDSPRNNEPEGASVMAEVCVCVHVVATVEAGVGVGCWGSEHDINLFTQSHCGYPPSSGVQKLFPQHKSSVFSGRSGLRLGYGLRLLTVIRDSVTVSLQKKFKNNVI